MAVKTDTAGEKPREPPTRNPAVYVLVVGDHELDPSPEFQDLAHRLVGEARQAFGSAARVSAPAEADPTRPLLVVDGRVLLLRRSLEAMGEALAATSAPAVASTGTPRAVAVPTLLTDTPLPGERPVYTLRGFEILEEMWQGRDAPPLPAAPWPAVLLPAGAHEALAPGLTGRQLLDSPPEGLAATAAGLCHRFVDYYGEAREDVLPFVPEGAEEVLEVGCARGATGRFLQERLGCRVTGIELNPVVARAAAETLHRVITGDVEELAGRLAAEGWRPYDALIAFELFEHLTDQWGFLEAARKLVRPGGRIVLSVPNVGHYSVVEDLLSGRWDYLPIGLLCSTHYRFFTRRTLEDWLTAAGFETFELIPQETELPRRFEAPLPGLPTDRQSLRTQGFYVVIDLVG